VPALGALRGWPYGDRTLIEHIQAVLDAVCNDPLPFEAPGSRPVSWWSAMPALYVAALFQHAGLPAAVSRRRGPTSCLVPHARDSAVVARAALREMGMDFAVREHAVGLLLHQNKPFSLPAAGAPAETYQRLSCCVDLHAVHALRAAEARAWRDNPADVARLTTFRQTAEQLGIFDSPHPPPLDADRVRSLGFLEPRELYRALNALRYFELDARMYEKEWCVERLRQESSMPRGRLHLLIGPAGTGKSHWAAEHLAHTQVISSDQMRQELTGDPADQSQNYLVFQRCMDRVRALLHAGAEVTFDATNYSRALRHRPVQAARWSAAEIVSYFFDVGLKPALGRNAGRERIVPEPVIRRQHRLLEPPALYEADRHVVVDERSEARVYWPVD